MSLPIELAGIEAETDVVGDIEAFMLYVDSGSAARDWEVRHDLRMRELDQLWSESDVE